MASVFCSQAHPNVPGSRFCHRCGEPLGAVVAEVTVGGMLGDRYRIVKELGQGGFGKTYLAEDQHRFREACVLKEFAPQVQGREALKKAEELFEREAGVLYQLQHPQIPRFRELFRVQMVNGGRLFLVQDYVEGASYRELLQARLAQNQTFTEADVIQLFMHLLPVLQYIHTLGVIHRDIAPDNLILRSTDQMPVLIDFGGVKQIAVSVSAKVTPIPHPVTRVGKVGYAPVEQMDEGRVSPDSDLYALAVTAIVLLTGQEPDLWLNDRKATWKRQVKLSPQLGQMLDRMLASRPGDRFPSAEAVLQALRRIAPQPLAPAQRAASHPAPPPLPVPPPLLPPYKAAPAPTPSTRPTLAVTPVAPAYISAAQPTSPAAPPPTPAPMPVTKRFQPFWGVLFVLVLMGSATVGVWTTRDRWLPITGLGNGTGSAGTTDSPPNSPLSATEQSRQQSLSQRRRELGIDLAYLIRLTDESFYARYPELNHRSLTLGAEDAPWREKWDAIANEWLDVLEQTLSAAARKKLGSFGKGDREAMRQAVLKLNVGAEALNDLTDGRFFQRFPEWEGRDFLEKPIGQVWQAIAADQVDALQAGQTLARLQFPEGGKSDRVSGELEPGAGRVYLAELEAGQELRLELDAPANTLLSIYVPKPTPQVPLLLADSTQHRWRGRLPQSGFYEFVIVSRSDRPVRYRLRVATEE